MSIRRAFLVILIFLPAAYWLSATLDRLFLEGEIIGSARVGSIGRARGRIVHVLSEDRWTRFRIPARSTGAKVIAYAACESSGGQDPEGEVRFALRYRLVDRGGEVRAEREYWFRSRVTRLTLGEVGETLRRAFFLEPGLVPADGRASILDIGDPEDLPLYLDVQLGEHDPRVVDVVGRFFFQERMTASEGEERWDRMGRSARERAVRASVYSADLLTDYERSHLASTRWSRVAPEGVGGEDYTSRRLYIVSGEDLRSADSAPDREAVLVDSNIHGILHIPETGADVRLIFGAVDDPESPFGSVELRWYGRRPHEATTTVIGVPTRGGIVERSFDGGTVEVRSALPFELRYQISVDEAWTPPRAATSRWTLYAVDETHEVHYAIHRSPERESVLRLTLRSSLEAGELEAPALEAEELEAGEPEATWIEIEWRSADGSPERVLPVEVPAIASEHDFIAGIGSRVPVSEPLVLYLRPQETTAAIVLRGISGRALASASTSLSSKSRSVRVPEDAFAFERDARDPHWLSVRPWNRQELADHSGLVTLVAQSAPRDRKEWLLSGDFHVEPVDPEGPWSGRFLLLSVEPDAEDEDDEPSPLELTEVPVRRAVEVEVLPIASERPMRFFYERRPYDGRFGTCRVSIEGAATRELSLFGEFGEAQLEGLTPGYCELRVDGDDVERVFLEGARVAGAPSFRRRFAARLGPALVFRYLKRSEEEVNLFFKVYLSTATPERVLACVRIATPISGAFAAPDCTPTERTYDLRADLPADVRVVGDRGLLLRRARSFVVPLGRDIPAGPCAIELSLPAGILAYGYAYEIVRGREDERRVVIGARDAD